MKIGDRLVLVVSQNEITRMGYRGRASIVDICRDRLLAKKFDLNQYTEVELYDAATGREFKFTQVVTADHWYIKELGKQKDLERADDLFEKFYEDYFGLKPQLQRLADSSLRDMNRRLCD